MKLPKFLQPVLWSVKIKDLDLKQDKIYIIHQILSFGNLKELEWLFKHYSIREIKEVFLKKPLKIYRPPSFNFIREMIVKNESLDIKKYVPASL